MRVIIKFSTVSRNYPIVTTKPCLFEIWIINDKLFFNHELNSFFLFHVFGIYVKHESNIQKLFDRNLMNDLLDISKHNKNSITLVSNLFANLNEISNLFRVFWPEIRLQLHVNGFVETYAVKVKSTLFVRKTHATFWMQLKQCHVALLETQQFGCMFG